MPTAKQDASFLNDVAPNALDTAIAWIERNLDPEDVFTERTLMNWADRHGLKAELEEGGHG